jgi:SAM-dependent methyltransferase
MFQILDRQQAEQAFHDQQAAERAVAFARGQAHLTFRDRDYLEHETWIGPAFSRLGELTGLEVLDYGCGHGMAAVVMARRGARVTAFDLSPGYVAETQRRATVNGVPVRSVVADAEQLPFADASFDRIWGNAVLHHLDLHRAGAELWRVLKPGGWAVFCEPWGENPILRFARAHLPYPGKQRTVHEQPLTRQTLQPLKRWFPKLECQGFQLLGMCRRLRIPRAMLTVLDRTDQWLLPRFPVLENWCRYLVLKLPRG